MTSSIDSGISSAVKESSKLSITKTLFDGRVETTITAEKDTGCRRNSTDLWHKNSYFKAEVCDFSLEKANMPENTIFTSTRELSATRIIKRYTIAIRTF